MLRNAALVAALLATAGPAFAQGSTLESLTQGGRYALLELNDQIVRLDTDTGVFSLCRKEGAAWTCVPTVDERKALEDRIAALVLRVEALERASVAAAPVPAPLVVGLSDSPLAGEPSAGAVPAPLASPTATGGAPTAPPQSGAELPPLAAPQEVAERPVPLAQLAGGDKPEPETKSWLRRMAGKLPFVD